MKTYTLSVRVASKTEPDIYEEMTIHVKRKERPSLEEALNLLKEAEPKMRPDASFHDALKAESAYWNREVLAANQRILNGK